MDLLKELCETPGVPGREERLRAIVRRELTPLVNEVRVDALGNLLAVKRGSGAGKLMIAAHMDEIGFIVSFIDDQGFLRLQPIGGHDPRNMVGQRVLVCGETDLPGILYPARKPPHLQDPADREKAPKIEEFFVDMGLPARGGPPPRSGGSHGDDGARVPGGRRNRLVQGDGQPPGAVHHDRGAAPRRLRTR